MKKLAALCLCALAAALVLIPLAPAGCRRVAAPTIIVHDQVAVVQPAVVATTFLQVPVPVYPIYGVGYGQGDTAAEVRALTAELARLRAALTPVPSPPTPLPPGGRGTPPAAMPRADDASHVPDATKTPSAAPKVIAAACLRCHATASPKNGNVSLAGDVPLLVRLKAFRAVSVGSMPKGGAEVSEEDLGALAKWAE